jgi:hypothetical protein
LVHTTQRTGCYSHHFSETLPLEKLILHLSNKFQNLYLPNRNIAIDESFTVWKCGLSFGQYIPFKAAKFGIKMYELCEFSSSYVWFFLVYTGPDMVLVNLFVTAETNNTEEIVVKVSEPLLGHGDTVCMDSFYNSPELAWFMKFKKTDCLGTLHANRNSFSPCSEE